MPSTNNNSEESEVDTSTCHPGSSVAASTASASASASTSTVYNPFTLNKRSAVWDNFEKFPIEDEDVQKKLFTYQCRYCDKRLKLNYK